MLAQRLLIEVNLPEWELEMNNNKVRQVATVANIVEATVRVMESIVGEDIASKPSDEIAADAAAIINKKLQGGSL